MSYFFVIVGTRDNPLYTADLASKPSTSSGPASFFSSSSSSSTNSSAVQAASGAGHDEQGQPGSSSGGGGIFGFGGSLGLGALAGGLSSRASGSSGTAQQTSSSAAGEGTGIGFGRYNDRHVLQMIAHSSLDVVEDRQFAPQWAGGGGGGASGGAAPMYMKSVDRINEWTTSAFLVPGSK